MPITEEIRKIGRGMKARPPRQWFIKMKKIAKKQYPNYSEKRLNKIVAGIWYKMPLPLQLKILRAILKGVYK